MQSTFKMVSFRGQKRLGHAQIGLLILKFPRASPPLSYGRPPGNNFIKYKNLKIKEIYTSFLPLQPIRGLRCLHWPHSNDWRTDSYGSGHGMPYSKKKKLISQRTKVSFSVWLSVRSVATKIVPGSKLQNWENAQKIQLPIPFKPCCLRFLGDCPPTWAFSPTTSRKVCK